MNILIIDILSPSGHVNYNKGIIRALREPENTISFWAQKDMVYKVCGSDNIETKVIPDELFLNYSKKLSTSKFAPIIWRYALMRWYKINASQINKFDYVLFTSAEPLVVAFISWRIKTRCGFIDHGIGKIEISLLYKWSYKYLLRKNIDVITLEEYISEYVNKVIHKQTRILYHPIFVKDHISTPSETDEDLIFAPSGGNDVEFIQDLYSKKGLISGKIKIVIRNSQFQYIGDRLIIYSKPLQSDEYYDYMSKAICILIPYEKTYNYRTSAIFFEAMTNGKPVIILRNNTLSHLAMKFPRVAFLINSCDEIENVLNQIRDINKQEFANVLNHYSDQVILKQFENICRSESLK